MDGQEINQAALAAFAPSVLGVCTDGKGKYAAPARCEILVCLHIRECSLYVADTTAGWRRVVPGNHFEASLTLQQICDFIAVVQHGSLNAAARMTGQAQPSLSKSLRRLEESVGAPLLVRGAKGVRLTPFGECFLTHARLIAAEAERAHSSIRDLQGESVGEVRFGISPMSSLMLGPTAMTMFRRVHPQTILHSVSGLYHVLAPMMREGQIDFAVCPAPDQAAPDLGETPILRCKLSLVARPGHPLASSTSLRQLQNATFVMGAPQGVGGIGIRGAFARQGLPPPKVDMHADSMIDTLAYVLGSDRLALIPTLVVNTEMLKSVLVRVPIAEELDTYDVSVIYRRDSPLSTAARVLTEMFQRSAAYVAKDSAAVTPTL